MHKCAILQSNYIPWKGVFDMINQVDSFVFFEDVDFTKRDWRTRNKIKNVNGDCWLSIPVKKAPRGTKIYQIEISQDELWQHNHYKSIIHAYRKAPFFNKYKYLLDEIYLQEKWVNLSTFNIFVTKLLTMTLGIKTQFINSVELGALGNKDCKLIDICKKIGADFYLSGPAARNYIRNDAFTNENIRLAYIRYNDYPSYPQLHGEFDHYVSVLDVLFNCGDNSSKYVFQNQFEVVN